MQRKEEKNWTVDWIEGWCTMVYTGMIGTRTKGQWMRDEGNKGEGKGEEGWDTMMEESRIKGHHYSAMPVLCCICPSFFVSVAPLCC